MKTRTVHRTRQVPHTIDGITRMVDEEYTIEVPVPPRDWDHILLQLVTVLASLLIVITVVWSTANIGDLLARVTIVPAAYAAAGAFDLAWVMCMAVEWLARYDRRRARLPRRAGHVALVIAMLAVGAHGWIEGQRAVGIIGATVSALVKGLWTIVIGYYSAPLDPRTQAWVEQQLAAAGAQQALIPVKRQLQRAGSAVTAERLALAHAERKVAELQNELDIADGTVQQLVKTSLERKQALDQAQKPNRRVQPPSKPAGPVGTPIDDVSALLKQAHAPIVYFLRNGSRVKIGVSQNLRRRVAALSLRPDDLVRVEHGGQDHERALHARFAAHRAGNTEWFELRGELARYLGEPETEPAEPEAQPAVEPTEPVSSAPIVVLPSAQAAAPEPEAQPDEPQPRAFGFSVPLAAQSAQRAEAVKRVAELVAQDSGITSAQVAELLSVSPATAKRYLREARQGGRP